MVGKVKKYIIEGLAAKANEWGVPIPEVQLLLQLGEENIPVFKICLNYKPKELITDLQEFLQIKIDFVNISNLVPAFVQQTLINMCGELGIEPGKISAMIINGEKMIVWIYNDKQPIKSLSLDELFG